MTLMQASCLCKTRANVLGIGIHAVDVPSAVDIIEKAVARHVKGYVCVTGVHGVMEARRDPVMRTTLSRALMVVPDGTPTVWMGRLQGLRQMRRVFGPDLMLAVMSHSSLQGCSHFLYGGDYGIAQALQARLEQRCPTVRIVGTYTPPFRALNPVEESDLFGLLNQLRPDIVWVGLSTPKQERFMAEYLPRLNTTLMIGVGAAFDFHAGRLKDSPRWIKALGLQWLHRLYQEPKRLWKRYLTNNPLFIVGAILQLTGLRRYQLPLDSPDKVRSVLLSTQVSR
jgi:N-acetylglucosaminyldiphosphoundecaprenol N-acetyl-beta-D-mannosaminyltransferase